MFLRPWIVLLFLNMGFADTNSDKYQLKALQDKMEYFYMDPQESIAKEIISDLNNLKVIDNYYYIITPLAEKYPDKILQWLNEANIDIHDNFVITVCLNIAGLQSEALVLAKKANLSSKYISLAEHPLKPIKDMPYSFEGYIYYLFNEFVITGDIEYIKKMISVFDLSEEDIDEPDIIENLRKDATTVLSHLTYMHDKVYKFCKEEVKSSQKKSKTILTKLLSDLDKIQKGLKGRISITDDPNFENTWYNTPIMTGPKCSDVVTFPSSENKIIKVFVIFSGFDLDKDSCANLTYDIEFYNSKKIKIASYQDLVAIKRKLYSHFFYQLSEDVIGFGSIRDPSDERKDLFPPGIYSIKVTLKDQISKKVLN